MTPEEEKVVAQLELAVARLMLRLEAELDDTAAVAIVHDCGVDADRLREMVSDLDRLRREFVYPAGCRPRPGVIESYQQDEDTLDSGYDVIACYSYPTADPNVHDLKVVKRRRDVEPFP